jgi:hypothetical protein
LYSVIRATSDDQPSLLAAVEVGTALQPAQMENAETTFGQPQQALSATPRMSGERTRVNPAAPVQRSAGRAAARMA